MSPLYTTETEGEWKLAVEEYAAKLAARFEQFRVYVEYSRKEIKIFQKS
jgi:subtilisin-like proprotein convertase family protein